MTTELALNDIPIPEGWVGVLMPKGSFDVTAWGDGFHAADRRITLEVSSGDKGYSVISNGIEGNLISVKADILVLVKLEP